MKSLFVLVIILMPVQLLLAQERFQITGKFDGNTAGKKAVLSYIIGEDRIEKTALIKNGRFSIAGEVPYPRSAMLRFFPVVPPPKPAKKETSADIIERIAGRDEVQIYLEAGKIVVTGTDSVKNAKITGGRSMSELNILNARLQKNDGKSRDLVRKMVAAMRKDDSLALKAIRSDQDQLLDELYSINAEFVKQYPDSYVSWDLQRVKTEGMDATEAEEAYNAMSERLRNSVAGKKAAAHIKKLKRTAIGNPAPLFTQADTEGKPVSLASFRGKYVLLDFWASWCSPCRDENPNVVKAFKQFRDKKLEIISVSLDSKKKDWLNAINEDGMPWIHVCDLKGTKNSVALLYGVIAVPQNFLVDPDGKIIAHNLRGEELIPALEKLIK